MKNSDVHCFFSYKIPISGTAWIISGPRSVQTQAALNEAVYVILRIQGSEVLVLRSGHP